MGYLDYKYIIQSIVSLVAVGMGVSMVPSSLRGLQRSGVVYRPLEGLAATRRTDDKNPALYRLPEIIREAVESMDTAEND